MDTAAFAGQTTALFDHIRLLLGKERKLLEARDLDWEGLEGNLRSIEDLLKLLPLMEEDWAGREGARFLPAFCKSLDDVIALRRDHAAILQARINEMGKGIVLLKQKKTALLSYRASQDQAGRQM